MTSNQIEFKTCSTCKRTLLTSAFCKNKKTKDGYQRICKICSRKSCQEWYNRNPHTQHLTNKTCSTFLGITVAERVLSKVFKDVKTMPPNNKGFDFWWNNGFKIDVKSSCQRKSKIPSWSFKINRNKIADYFLCLALDNREDLNPLHLWLIPGNIINHLNSTSVSKSTAAKWNEYKLDLTKTVACCSALK